MNATGNAGTGAGPYVVSASAVADLVEARPLCCILSGEIARPVTAMLPLLVERDADGGLFELFGHIPRRAPLAGQVADGAPVLVLANGPNAYVSPTLVPQPDWGPTWNFAMASIVGTWRLCEAETDESLRRLARRLEGDGDAAWTVERMGPRYERLRHAVVAFRIVVTAIEPRFKLGQDESDANFDAIVASHSDRDLAAWMRDFRSGNREQRA
ncbi:MAG: hypothetical protein DI632_06265 [Sphingomonas hengshuiensis]|uniref:FMN-binding negative transcriptional regulator n=1 Tax=Sphingomonas hengshuiensis TaxID=1609977 RepID=A0A2W4Z888_9SPHN|nr:MAG: hypothetical protein DI632_06265 [Sphingomonas hengshuiensis]